MQQTIASIAPGKQTDDIASASEVVMDVIETKRALFRTP